MPNTSRSFQNLAPFEPRFDNVKNHTLEEPTPLGTLDGSMFFEQDPPPEPNPGGGGYSEGDIWVYQGDEFTITYILEVGSDNSFSWRELGRVPKGKSIRSILPFAFTMYREEKVGEATICGYSEFADPSDPPKKYKRLDATVTDGYDIGDETKAILICSFTGVNNCTPPTCAGQMPEVEGETNIVGFGQEFGWRGSLLQTSASGSSVTFTASCSAFYDPDGANSPRAARIQLSTEPPTYLADGATITLTIGTNLTASIQFEFLVSEWATAYGECLLVGYNASGAADTWEITGQYNSSCKLAESREVYRRVDPSSCEPTLGLPTSNINGETPLNVYGADNISVTESKTSRQYGFNLPCTAGELEYPTSIIGYGTVIYTLSEEDTMDDAVGRFAANPYSGGKKWSGGWPEERAYSEREEQGDSFSVDVVLSRVNVTIGGLEPNASYTILIDLWQGPYRSIAQGDYSPSGVLSATVTASESGGAGASLEVPATEGYTTVAVIKSVVKN